MATLTANGHPLDTSAGRFGELEPMNELIGDPEGLREAMAERGHLFFRGLIDPDQVLAARREILEKYAIIGEIDDRGLDGVGSVMDGITIPQVESSASAVASVNLRAFSASVRGGHHYTAVVEAAPLLGVHEALLGGEVKCFDFRWPRFVRPGEGCGFHCDGPYMNRGTDRIYSSWIPLGAVDRTHGGLIVLEDSHESDALHHGYLDKDADDDGLVWLDDDPVAVQQRYGRRWLTADYEPGDVLCFSMHTLHGALDNQSPVGRCRLTSDSRYQRADEPADPRWNGMADDGTIEGHGAGRVFYPGLGRWNNEDFQDEWKFVDDGGRLRL